MICTRTSLLLVLVAMGQLSRAAELPLVDGVELQPLAAQAKRVAQALELLGSPLTGDQQAALEKAIAQENPETAIKQIQAVLDPLCLAGVNINPESRVKVAEGPAAKRLMQHGWRVFLVKVHNEGGVTAGLAWCGTFLVSLGGRQAGSWKAGSHDATCAAHDRPCAA